MSVVRVVFLGTPGFAKYHLEKVLEDSHYDVVGVVTQPDRPSGRHMHLTPSPVKELAMQKDLRVITPEKVSDPGVIEEIRSWKAEAAIVVAFGQILPQAFLDLFPEKIVNVHGSLLPKWRGAAPIQRSIMAGDIETGVSLQIVVKKLDAGAVLGSYSLKITDDMPAMDLHDKLMPLGAQLLHVEFMDYLRGNLTPIPQDESKVTYAHKIDKSESLLDWNLSARELHNRVRGLTMGPGASTTWQGKRLKIHKSALAGETTKAQPGEILHVENGKLIIACGQGSLELIEVQPESKPRMSVHDFLLGHKLQKGERLK